MPFYPAGHHFPFLASPRFAVTWPGLTSFSFRVREKARFTHVIAFLQLDVRGKRFSTHGKTTERGNVAKKSLRFHARFYNSLKINFPENQA